MLILPFLAFATEEEDKKEETKAYYLNVASDEDEKDAEKEEVEKYLS